MNEEEYKKLLQRVADHQKRLKSHSDKRDDFALVEKRLADMPENAKKRIVGQRGGQ